MFEKKVVEKNKTQYYIEQLFFENRAIYEICGKILQTRTGHR
jgi:hypothetical protein